MESVSKQEYMQVLSELDMLTNKFVALEQENQRLLGDLQQVSACEKTDPNLSARSCGPSNHSGIGQSNSFEVLSQLDELLNE